jgi:hypothetical protein
MKRETEANRSGVSFARFHSLAKRLLAVPKAKADRYNAADVEKKPRKPCKAHAG